MCKGYIKKLAPIFSLGLFEYIKIQIRCKMIINNICLLWFGWLGDKIMKYPTIHDNGV